MPTNEQRRATAKRKLERQLERRAEKARKRRILTIAGLSTAAVVVVAALVGALVWSNRDSGSATASASTETSAEATEAAEGTVNCAYDPSTQPASKDVTPPNAGAVPTDPPQISASMATDQGPLGLQLDNAKAPCTVNSFASLAQKGYFDETTCHRLTTSPSLSVLQCGDPTGSGSGGPGYQFANEYPTNQYAPGDPALQAPISYPRGTLAMANAGPGTNGSQFFLVYGDSQLPPNYTIFGTIDETGLATLDKIAKAGVADGSQDGAPKTPVKITSIQLD